MSTGVEQGLKSLMPTLKDVPSILALVEEEAIRLLLY
jgi:hypothetical protein